MEVYKRLQEVALQAATSDDVLRREIVREVIYKEADLLAVGTKIAGIREFDTLDIKWSFPGEVEGDYPIPEQAGVSISPPMPWTEFTMTLELAEVKYAITDWAKLRQLGQYQANFSRRRAVEKLAALKDENILSAIVAGVHSNLTITDVEDWDADTKTGDEIAADITAAIGKILQYSNVRETDIANMACIVPVDVYHTLLTLRQVRNIHQSLKDYFGQSYPGFTFLPTRSKSIGSDAYVVVKGASTVVHGVLTAAAANAAGIPLVEEERKGRSTEYTVRQWFNTKVVPESATVPQSYRIAKITGVT